MKERSQLSWSVRGRQCLAAALMVMSGCGGNHKLSEVTGVVNLDGKPLADSMIVFSPTGEGTTSYGRTDSEGRYRMLFRDNEYGAWLGENLVRITTFDLGAGGEPGKKELVPTIYNTKSTTKVMVNPGSNTHNFDLKSTAGKVMQGPRE